MPRSPRRDGRGGPPERATPAAKPGFRAGEAIVRMYRQGLGDCFLVFMPRSDGSFFKMMIDCGVIMGTEDAQEKMQRVVRHVAEATDGFVDILVVTHEHWDHVSGFTQAESLFRVGGTAADDNSKLGVGTVWFAWTEDDRDPTAKDLKQGLSQLLEKVRHMGSALSAMAAAGVAEGQTTELAVDLAEVLAFHGIDAATLAAGAPQAAADDAEDDAPGGPTRKAMKTAAGLSKSVEYRSPGEPPWQSQLLPGVRIFTLGPPRDPRMLRKTLPGKEGFHIAFDGEDPVSAGFGFQADADDADADAGAPFDRNWGLPLPERSSHVEPPQSPSEFIRRHYLASRTKQTYSTHEMRLPGDPMPGSAILTFDVDQSWRRIDADWTTLASDFAMALDGATNNTSLVLAIELSENGPVLLFVGDAQAGNWLSWSSLSWKIGERTVTAADLLARTIFYKVGHHGSHNATLKGLGLDLMQRRDLVAFVPVDRPMARRKRWNRMPLPSIMDRLDDMTQSRVLLAERAPPDDEKSWVPKGLDAPDYAGRFHSEDLFADIRLPMRRGPA